MKTNLKPYALITGASQGLGKALAIELAKQAYNLLLVALPNENLPILSANLHSKYGVEVEFFETNLVSPDSAGEIAAWVAHRPLKLLINNAGIGGTRRFEQVDQINIDAIIGVNVRSMALVTWYLQNNLKSAAPSFILNVASMASFSPIAYKSVYPASKAFVRNFSLGLREEMKEFGVSVSVLNPGPMATNADVCSRIGRQSSLARIGVITVDKVAAIGIREMLRGRAVIIPGVLNRIYRFLMGIVPGVIRIPLISSFVKRELQVGQGREVNVVLGVK